jgi:DNA-binding HxlR family transcriptional regulator
MSLTGSIESRVVASSAPQNVLRVRERQRSDLDLIERVRDALYILSGKWKVYLLVFMAHGIHRYSRLVDSLPGASKKIVTDTLRALERDGLVERRAFAEVPVRVEYSLTPLGWTIAEPLIVLAEWSEAYGAEVVAARLRYQTGDTDRTPDEGRVTHGRLAA